jgi:HlyD family secretion protein
MALREAAMRKRAIFWIFTLVLVALGVAFFVYYKNKHAPPPYTFQTEPVSKRHIQGRVTATGTLLATVMVQVGTQVSGRVSKLFVDYNSAVKKGQIVAKIDPILYQAALDNVRANYLQAKAQLESVKATAELDRKLYARELALQKDNLASQQDVETAETTSNVANANVDVAKATLAQVEAGLHTAEANLMYTDIISPIDGTVISRSVDVGQTVAASLAAPTLFTIAEDLHKMQVNTNIAEGDVGRLEVGMDATFTVDAFPGRTFKGKISQIRNAATTLQNVVTYDAVIDVINDDPKLRPGMTANTTVIYAEKDDALSVSNAALRFRPPPEVTAPESSGSVGEHHHHERGEHAERGDGTRRDGGLGGVPPAGDGNASSDAGAALPPGEVSVGDRVRPEGKTVWMEKGSLVTPVHVRLGLTDGSYTEVMGRNVHEGDLVIVDALPTGKSSPGPGGGGPGGGGQRRMFF